jgi:hypothetical protein
LKPEGENRQRRKLTWEEQESRALEHTDTLLAEGTEVLRRLDAASSSEQEVGGLKAALEATVGAAPQPPPLAATRAGLVVTTGWGYIG